MSDEKRDIDRRRFLAGFIGTLGIWQIDASAANNAPRSYTSATLSLQMLQGGSGYTLLFLTEHGDANYALVEAFYWTPYEETRIMLHKETSCPLIKATTVAADVALDMKDIAYLRIKEMILLADSRFGDA